MFTEQEAKDRWCPHVRFQDTEPDSQPANSWSIHSSCSDENKYGTERNPKICRCIASECMMWRWENDLKSKGGEGSKGFCGLAGKIG
ncbi:MAG: hypothetical protein UW18_C0021G0004 [Microgenomates group bacterium GW2011_GWF1_44_10]|nr:MAG: hypothetical protein UW18_C0021G0004 [Microgenomates group bacterium GW2011_GWF1_44_10]